MEPVGLKAGSNYEIRVAGLLSTRWADWFEGFTIVGEENHETILQGWVVDQAALFGILQKVYSLNLQLTAVKIIK